MAQMLEARADSRRSASARVTPTVFVHDEPCLTEIIIEDDSNNVVSSNNGESETNNSLSEANPHDAWLPITESRKGNAMTAMFHLLNSGIGIQVLVLPSAFISLGWFWGILCLSVLSLWQLYTKWLLVDLHESTPPNGIRYSRYLHLSIVAFGVKLGKLLALFPTLYLSSGTCVIYIISGGTLMKLFYKLIACGNSQLTTCEEGSGVTGAQWFLVFACVAIFVSQFFPNLNSLAAISTVGSIAAVAYCSLLWILTVAKGRLEEDEVATSSADIDHGSTLRHALNAIGIIAFAFRGQNLVLEIQGTMPTSPKQPSRNPMWRGVAVSYLLIAMCLYPVAIVGHWAYRDKMYGDNSSILVALTRLHQKQTSKYLIGAIYVMIIINYVCAFQIYAVPAYDNFQRIYTTKKDKPCPKWVRSAIKILFGGVTYFVSVAVPFLPKLAPFIGAIALPLTLVYPCFMWVALKKPVRFSRVWCLNLGLGVSGAVLSVLLASAGLWSLIVNGLDANFFKPLST